jgi:5'-nucleotidase
MAEILKSQFMTVGSIKHRNIVMKPLKILLTNDDGYNAPGIQALYEVLSPFHDVIIIAPDRDKSAVSHGISLNQPLRLEKVKLYNDKNVYSVSGTPADCVKLGLFELYNKAPNLIISGINPGTNTGVNINYSGTAGAAREGAINKITSIAVSVKKKGRVMDFDGMAMFTAKFLEKIHDIKLPCGTFLNINAPDIPITESTPVRITRQGQDNISQGFDKRMDPRTWEYYWYSDINRKIGEDGTDNHAIAMNAISITPVKSDATDYDSMRRLMSCKDNFY